MIINTFRDQLSQMYSLRSIFEGLLEDEGLLISQENKLNEWTSGCISLIVLTPEYLLKVTIEEKN